MQVARILLARATNRKDVSSIPMKIPALLLLASTTALAQHFVPQKTFDAIANEFSGEQAQENTRRIVEYHRIQGSPMMAEVAERVVLSQLHAQGIEASIEQFPSDGQTKYGTFISPMGWNIKSGELWVESAGGIKNFQPVRLCRFADVPMCVSTYSKGGDWSGELVDVGAGTSDSDYSGKNPSGKVALASGYAANVVREAVIKRGAVGVVIYPAAGDRPGHPDMVLYNGIWPRSDELAKTSGGFQISRNQYEQLKEWMSLGPVRVHGKIDATLAPGQLTLVHASIRGSEHPEREIVITAHLDHPKWSANDNASGSGTLIEMARTLHTLITEKKIPAPGLTIHFIWVPEYFGTAAYVANHPEARRCGEWDDPRHTVSATTAPPVVWNSQRCILANLNLDMVGEDTVKTNSRFYFTRTPDSVPSFLTALMSDVAAQTREANLYAPTGTHNYWQPEVVDYVQGSDHDIFLGLGIPATMMGHDPDWTHHTSEDKLDKTDTSEFRRVGVLATAAAEWMASATPDAWQHAWLATVNSLQQERTRRFQKIFAALAPPGLAERQIRINTDELTDLSDGFLNAIQHLGEPVNASEEFSYQKPIQLATPLREAGVVPHRLAILPFDASAFEQLSGADRDWWQAQQQYFSSESEGLPTKPTFDLLMFEAVNLMDGKRNTGQIADLLSAEFLMDFDQLWVDRLAQILRSRGLIAVNP
jgi:hypothetical protein